MNVVFVVAFIALWAGSTLLLSCLPWFQRRPTAQERVETEVRRDGPDWLNAVEDWLARQ